MTNFLENIMAKTNNKQNQVSFTSPPRELIINNINGEKGKETEKVIFLVGLLNMTAQWLFQLSNGEC